MFRTTALSTLLLPLTLLGATTWTCDHVTGEGDVIKKTIDIDAFHGIALNGSMDVVLVKADVQSVEIEAQPNIAELITTEVKNGTWMIGTSKGYTTNKTFIVRIKVPSIDKVHINGSGDVMSEDRFDVPKLDLAISGSGDIIFNVKCGEVRAAIDGSGDMRLKGECTTLDVGIAGSGDVSAADLSTNDLDVSIAGSGDVSASAGGNVDAAIAGSGDVLLTRKPAQMNKRIAGSGEVHMRQ